MFTQLTALMEKPKLYENGTAKLWDDEHISKGMLEAHLNPDWDAATRNHAFVREVVKWIGAIAPANKYPALLDLGCGPGIFAELFHEKGYNVTGIDFSKRSIGYAKDSASEKDLPITYHYQDYLTLDFTEKFDIVTLIYCDFGVLSSKDRAKLLTKIHTALKPGGLLIFDVFAYLADRNEGTSWEYNSKGGFFSPQPHLCINSIFLYEENRTSCARHIIVTEQDVKSINIWEHTFTKDELVHDLSVAGFTVNNIYGNITGYEYRKDGKEICVVSQKK